MGARAQHILFYWPWELHTLIKEARIMTFGYDANIKVLAAKNLMGIHDHAVNLLARLRNERTVFPVSESILGNTDAMVDPTK